MGGKFYEDLAIGERFSTSAHTISQADINRFADLSGDYNPIHLDSEFARHTPFGQPIAHGLLIVSRLSGLVERSGLHEGTIVALRRMEKIEFINPVFAGDSIHGELAVLDKQDKETAGLVKFGLKGMNQQRKVVVEMTYDVLLRKRNAHAQPK
jgi:acyl dehydratase